MLKNYLVAAIRNLFRDRAYAAINICGLALGFAAVTLIGLFVRDELSYDRAYPHSERTFRVLVEIKGATRTLLAVSDGKFARSLELDFPEVEFATRLRPGGGTIRQQSVEITTPMYRADPTFFRMFPPQVMAGDADAALRKPDTLVMTERFAQQLFGRVNVVGEAVELDRQQTMNVGAVIKNLPPNTHFSYDVIASTKQGELSQASNVYTYVRLRSGADVRKINTRMPEFSQRHFGAILGTEDVFKRIDLKLIALSDLHFLPPSVAEMKTPSDRRTVDAMIVIGLLILFVAVSNFVSMMTARSARRAIEVGVRKAVGATRRQIVVQFLGECLFYTGLAFGIAMIAVEIVLPGLNGFLQKEMAFDYVRDPRLGAAILAAWLIVALAAGAYPALVLSLFRPVAVLKGVLALPGGPGRLRNAMVMLQFATLVTLIVSTLTVQHQTRFAIEDQLRVPGDQLFVTFAPCTAGFRDIAMRIPGVREASCVSPSALGTDRGSATFALQTGGVLNLNAAHVGTTFFDLFGIRPLAGRLFDEQHGEDNLLARDAATTDNPSIILNESAARALGYANPSTAVGVTRYWNRISLHGSRPDGQYYQLDAQASQVVGVVADVPLGSIRKAIEPTVYFVNPNMSFMLVLKLDGKAIPETMRALETEWKKATAGSPFRGQFMSQIVNERYADILRQTKLFAAFSAIAIIVASLGLLGLAVFTAQRRTREIGLRKVMGASRSDILRFIAWQFARPVLIANLVAWPVAWFFMRRWLDGFAYHVDLGPLTFLLASALALSIALITVTGHAIMVSRARPVEALRYE